MFGNNISPRCDLLLSIVLIKSQPSVVAFSLFPMSFLFLPGCYGRRLHYRSHTIVNGRVGS